MDWHSEFAGVATNSEGTFYNLPRQLLLSHTKRAISALKYVYPYRIKKPIDSSLSLNSVCMWRKTQAKEAKGIN